MKFYNLPNPTLYAFLFFPSLTPKPPKLSTIGSILFDELYCKSEIDFFCFQHIGPDFCGHTEFYTDAALELVNLGLLLRVNVSNN